MNQEIIETLLDCLKWFCLGALLLIAAACAYVGLRRLSRALYARLSPAVIGVFAFAANPILPLWEYVPDGEPYVFEDPDKPGKMRVYLYGSHDTMVNDYCGYDYTLWSAPLEDLNRWRCHGVIFRSNKDANGNPLPGPGDVLWDPDAQVVTGKDGRKALIHFRHTPPESPATTRVPRPPASIADGSCIPAPIPYRSGATGMRREGRRACDRARRCAG